jgi:hypothetical protein
METQAVSAWLPWLNEAAVSVTSEYHSKGTQLLFVLPLLLGGACVLGYVAIAGRAVSVVGLEINGPAARLLAGTVSIVAALLMAWFVVKFALDRPDVIFEADALVAFQPPFRRRIRWEDIARVSAPAETSFGFGSTLTMITVFSRSGRRLRLAPNYREAGPDEFYSALMRRWEMMGSSS